VVVEAAREHLYGAASLADPALALAKECLLLLPAAGPSSAGCSVRRELDMIEALKMLPSMGVTLLLPMQLRQMADNDSLLEVMELVLANQVRAWWCVVTLQSPTKSPVTNRQSGGKVGVVLAAQCWECVRAYHGNHSCEFETCTRKGIDAGIFQSACVERKQVSWRVVCDTLHRCQQFYRTHCSFVAVDVCAFFLICIFLFFFWLHFPLVVFLVLFSSCFVLVCSFLFVFLFCSLFFSFHPCPALRLTFRWRTRTKLQAAPLHPPGALMRLARLLGLGTAPKLAEVEALLAQSAADVDDFSMAAELCLGLVERRHGASWRLCAQVAREAPSGCVADGTRQHLVAFALEHCADEAVEGLLLMWRRLEVG